MTVSPTASLLIFFAAQPCALPLTNARVRSAGGGVGVVAAIDSGSGPVFANHDAKNDAEHLNIGTAKQVRPACWLSLLVKPSAAGVALVKPAALEGHWVQNRHTQ